VAAGLAGGRWAGGREGSVMTAHPAGEDRLNAVGVLVRREIEARILAPVIDALGREFGRARVVEIVAGVIADVAREQGRDLARSAGDTSLQGFAATLEPWTRDDAMRIDVRASTDDRLEFDVTRCRYAEMYRALGIPELGAVLSCNRDAALSEGFNPAVTLTRRQTIMQGASCCDFRYTLARCRPSGEA
jgi:hypothetical protein